jgi:quercetin dioxygenase-like cupin family protein
MFLTDFSKEVRMEVNRKVEDIPWTPHPVVPGISIKPLISSKEHHLNVTCMLVTVPVGKEVPEHIHDTQDDILYPLKGKARTDCQSSEREKTQNNEHRRRAISL